MRITAPYRAILAFSLLLACSAPAVAQLSINYNIPGVSIGVNLGGYPSLQRIPGYPVYYAPGVNTNYFFYDGLYWVFDGERWYASSWYNGPWGAVDPFYVPDYVLRVPVRYYRRAPAYFRGWRADAPPRWDEHWGRSWHERRRDWDRWDRRSSPAPAPLPAYQRNYRGDRYPHDVQQREIHSRNYNYQPREEAWRGQYPQREQQQQRAQERQDRRDQSTVRQQKREERQMDRNDAERNSRLGAGG
jgi:hypothetical protein